MKDLVVLTADGTMLAALSAILARLQDLGGRKIEFDVYPHHRRDPGVRIGAQEFLRPFLNSHRYALAAFDRNGCGSTETAGRIGAEVQDNLVANGWRDRCVVLVLDPELEIWVWSNSPAVARALGWRDYDTLRQWLRVRGYFKAEEAKPTQPKEAMEDALRESKVRKSAAVYTKIAAAVDLRLCSDASFTGLRRILTTWFPPG